MSDSYTVLKGGRLVDGTGSEPVEEATVVIKGELIEAVGKSETVDYPQDARLIELSGQTIMPGLMDAHIHLLGVTTLNTVEWVTIDPYLRLARSVMDAWRLLDSGFTTVREVSTYHSLYIRQAIEEGSLPGPRILSCGKMITQTGGHGDIVHSLPVEWVIQRDICRIADGVDDCRKAVREMLRNGADFIKIMTSGGVMSERDEPTSAQFALDEIRAMVEEAHAAGKKVASHAQSNKGIKNALLAGVDTIEHGIYLDDEAVELMVNQGSFLIPTLAVVDSLLTKGPEAGIPEGSLKKARQIEESHLQSFLKAWKAGVKIGLGTDYLLSPHVTGKFMGDHAVELELYVKRAGLTSMEAIVCATRNNAQVFGLEERLGTLEPGKLADLLIVKGDPLADVSVLRDRANLEAVYKGGVRTPRLPG